RHWYDQLGCQPALRQNFIGKRLVMLVICFNREGHLVVRAIFRLIDANNEAFFGPQGVTHAKAIDELRPELAIVFFAVESSQPPHLVESDPDDFARAASAIGPDGDERLRCYTVGTL